MVSDTYLYVLVNLKKEGTQPEFFVVPSKVLANKVKVSKRRKGKSKWRSVHAAAVRHYKDRWDLFGVSTEV